jgi:hypothetical protein
MGDLEWMRARDKGLRKREAAQLCRAKEEASHRGKEPFDFSRLRELYDLSSDLSSSEDIADPGAAARAYEKRYYLDFPEVLTLADFARKLEEARPFR